MTYMRNNANDWNARLRDGAIKAYEAETKGMGSIARYVRDDVMPFIGMRMQEGALVWAPDSEENVSLIVAELKASAGVASVKGMHKGGAEYTETRNAGSFINRAVRFYAACCVLAGRTETAPIWDNKGDPLFPKAWFIDPDKGDLVTAKGISTHSKLSGKTVVPVLVLKDGDASAVSVTVSEARINSLASAKQRPPKTESSGAASEPVTMIAAMNTAASMMARADNIVSGEAADAFLDMVKAYAVASPKNMRTALTESNLALLDVIAEFIAESAANRAAVLALVTKAEAETETTRKTA
jgi:hypothetical protein